MVKTSWDVGQYEKFQEERARPFFDLLFRILGGPIRTAADLGCGTGELTRIMSDRWKEARITGVDTSEEMLAAAATRAIPGRLDFLKADAAQWKPARPLDLVLSNATLQWIPDHDRLLEHVASFVDIGGTLAVQMPNNFDMPSHTLLSEVASAGPWAATLRDVVRSTPVQPLSWYLEKLGRLGFAVDGWETTYHHVLKGANAALEWVRGTALRPVLSALKEPERSGFLDQYSKKLSAAYPVGPLGTLFPFRRMFFVARR